MDVESLSGEQIATMINGEYQKLLVTQQNLQILNVELEKRAKKEKPEVPEVKEEKK